MADEITCAKEALHDYKFKEILTTQDDHNKRLKILEESKIETRLEFSQIKTEFANLKQSQIEQKALILEIDRSSKEKMEKLFDKVLTSQDAIFNKVLENQNSSNSGKTEISKGKIALYMAMITAFVTIFTLVIEKIWS